jgi:hypothetical protein
VEHQALRINGAKHETSKPKPDHNDAKQNGMFGVYFLQFG